MSSLSSANDGTGIGMGVSIIINRIMSSWFPGGKKGVPFFLDDLGVSARLCITAF